MKRTSPAIFLRSRLTVESKKYQINIEHHCIDFLAKAQNRKDAKTLRRQGAMEFQ